MKSCWSMGMVIALTLAMGCRGGRKGESGGGSSHEGAHERPDPAMELAQKAEEALNLGDVDGAITILENGMVSLSGESRGRVLSLLLGILVGEGRIEDAQNRLIKALETGDQAAALEAFGIIEQALAAQEDGHERVLAWCERLDGIQTGKEAAGVVLRNRLTALQALQRHEEAMEALMGAWEILLEDQAVGLWSWLVQSAMGANRLEIVERALSEAERRGKPAALLRAAAVTRIELAFHRREIPTAVELLVGSADRLDDAALSRLVDVAVRVAQEAEAMAGVERWMEQFLAQGAFRDRANARRRAVRWYIGRSREAGDLAGGVERLRRLEAWGLPPPVLAGGLTQLSDLVLAPETPVPAVEVAIAFARDLLGRVDSDLDRAQVVGVILDGGFRTENYSLLEMLLQEGVPGHDAVWHETMLNKVRAHAALQRGDTEEAVRRFRAFMKVIEAQDDGGHRDPVTDERVTREMILGYNAKRIAGLLEKAGRIEEAAEARREAVRYYRKALEEFKPEDPEYQTIKKNLADLPQA